MSLEDYLKIASSLFTAASVLFAIYVYRRKEDQRAFAALRESITQLRINITRLDDLLSESHFTVLGGNIANRLWSLKPQAWSREQFYDYLTAKENHDQIANAILQGRLESDCITRAKELLLSVLLAPYSYKEQLPVLTMLLTKLLFYIKRVYSSALDPETFDRILGDPDAIREGLLPELKKYDTDEHALAELGVFVSACPSAVMKIDRMGQRLFDQSETLVAILTETLARKSDAELRRSKRKQKRLAAQLTTIRSEHAIEDAFEYFRAIRRDFSEEDWNRIVEAKTIVLELMKKKEA
jgi:hypothetical protein